MSPLYSSGNFKGETKSNVLAFFKDMSVFNRNFERVLLKNRQEVYNFLKDEKSENSYFGRGRKNLPGRSIDKLAVILGHLT